MAVELRSPTPVVASGRTYAFNGQLRPFQVEAVKYARWSRRTFIAHTMGLGKTIIAICTCYCENAFPLLIVCKAANKIQLVEEEVLARLPDRSVGWIGEVPKRLKGRVVADGYDCDIVVINDELLSRGDYDKGKTKAGKKIHGNTYAEKFRLRNWRAIIVDESHRYANNKSARAIALRLVMGKIPMRLFLTGTPVNPMPKKYINQLVLLGRLNEFGGWMEFVKRYCDAKYDPYIRGGVWHIDGHSNLDELVIRLKRLCYVRKTKQEVLPELPLVQRTPVRVQIENLSQYNIVTGAVQQWLKQVVPDGTRVPNTDAKGKINSLREIAATGKLPHIKEWVENFMEETEEENGKLLIFAYHRSIQQALVDLYPQAAHILGEDSKTIREEYRHRFNTDPSCRLMIAGLMVGGESLNITGASHMLFVELPWTPDALDQAEGRAYGRLDNPHGLNSYFMLAEDTIDIEMADMLDHKMQVMAHATDGGLVTEEQIVAALINKLRKSGENVRHDDSANRKLLENQ